MKPSRFSEEQILGAIKEAEAGEKVKTVCARHNISDGTYFTWKRKYGGDGSHRNEAAQEPRRGEWSFETIGSGSIGSEPDPQSGELKKVVNPASKRTAVRLSVESGLGRTAQAFRAMGLNRSHYYKVRQESVRSRRIRQRVIETSDENPRYGYRRVTSVMRREGHQINAKRVLRVRRSESHQVRKKQRTTLRIELTFVERRKVTNEN
jgi:putative transposase